LLSRLKGYYREIIILLVFVALSFAATYPLILRSATSVYGYPWPGDQTGTIWHFWWLKYAWDHSLSPYLSPMIAAPFGAHLSIQYLFLNSIVLTLSLLFREIFIYNLLIFISFPLSAFAMYLLAYRVSGNRIASVMPGLIFAFSPYHINQAQGHLTLAHIEWMPFYLLSLLMLTENKNYRNAILCGVSFALVVLSDLYYGFFMFIFTLIFFVYRGLFWLLTSRELKIDLKKARFYLVTLALAAALIFAFNLRLFQNTGTVDVKERVHPLVQLMSFSARPWDYLVPSITNPIFRRYTKPFIFARKHGSNTCELSLYLGYVPLLLAFIGVVYTWTKRKTQIITREKLFAVGFLVFGAFAALLCSAPPYKSIGALTVYFPSYLFFKFLPMFRSYSRFGIVVLMCVAVLAGVGLAYLLELLPGRRSRIALFATLTIFLGLEFAFIPRLTLLTAPRPVYSWLAKQKGDFVIAEYPLVKSDDVINYDYMFSQRIHSKRLVNGSSPYTEAEEWRIKVKNISDPDVPALLSYLKVKYVVLHLDKYRGKKQRVPYVPKSGLKIVKTFKNSRVYEVTATPPQLIVVPDGNFDKLERWDDHRQWRWMINDGELSVKNLSDSVIHAKLQFRAVSFVRPRRLKVISNGQVLSDLKISATPSRVIEIEGIELRPGTSKILLHSSPGAQEIDAVLHNLDTRQVSIAFNGLELAPSEEVN